MSINSSIRVRLKHLIDVLDIDEDISNVYIFVGYNSEQKYKLMYDNDTLIDDDKYIFITKEDIKSFLNKQASIIGVKKIMPIMINLVDNSNLEPFFKQ